MKITLSTAALIIGLAFPLAPAAQEAPKEISLTAGARPSFIQPNTWWNLYFSGGNDPLLKGNTSVNAVKILEVLEHQPSWIRITFPEKTEEHLSILRAVKRAQERRDVPIEKALADWEKTVSTWTVMWVNLDFVVYTTKVEPDNTPKGR